MNTIYLGLGSNLGNRRENIKRAVDELQKYNISVVKMSSIIETDPVGGPPQAKYLNAVIECRTDVPPLNLLSIIKIIEQQLGRIPAERNGPRLIDIDILTYSDLKINTPELTIPHPRMRQRDFVMKPFLEICPKGARELNDGNP